MKFDKIDSQGVLLAPRYNVLPGGTGPADEGRLGYQTSSQSLHVHNDSTSWIEVGGIPVGEEILFRTNTAVIGYMIVTGIDDEIVYITKGSAAGGEVGGLPKGGSTWTQPNHSHTISSDAAAHNHQWYDYTTFFPHGYTYNSAGVPIMVVNGLIPWGARCVTASDQADGSGPGNNQALSMDAYTSDSTNPHDHTGSTGFGASANSWRPQGRNFTIQKRL